MGIALFLMIIFLHIAFGLALAFFVMYFATKTEHERLKNFGFVVGYLLIALAVITMITSSILAATKHNYMGCPYGMHEKMRNEKMMQNGMPMMQEQTTENKNEKKIAYKQQIRKEGKGCPVKTKKEIEQDLKSGKRTGAACQADMKESKKAQKHEKY